MLPDCCWRACCFRRCWGGLRPRSDSEDAVLSAEFTAWMELLRAGARKVEKQTDGRVSFKFYPGGVMRDDGRCCVSSAWGVQGAVLTEGGLVHTYPDIQIYGLPLEFDLHQVDYVRRLDPVSPRGCRSTATIVGFAEVGFAYAMSKRPVTSVASAQTEGMDAGGRSPLRPGAGELWRHAHPAVDSDVLSCQQR